MAEKTIGDRQYRSTPLLATQAILLQARLLKVVGPGLSHLKAIMNKGGDEDEGAKEKAATIALEAFGEIVASADPVVVVGLIRDLVSTVEVRRPSGDYDPCDIDGDFVDDQRKYVYPVAVFAIQEQFGDFFGALPGIGSLVKRVRN